MIRQVEKNEVVMCLNSPTLPFLPCFIAFCSTHSYTSYFYEIVATCSCTFLITIVYFFFADNGIYEELFVRAKKHKSCCIMHNSLSLMTTFSNNMAALTVLNYETARNSSASVIYKAIAGMSESTRY